MRKQGQKFNTQSKPKKRFICDVDVGVNRQGI